MEYLNVTTAFLRSAAFLGEEPIDRATWLALAGYCALVENGGTIEDCREWKERRCQTVLGITRAEMLRTSTLWGWQGNNLTVHFYPAEQEAKVIRKRGIARHNGKLGGRPPKTEIGSDHGSDPPPQPGTEIGSDPEPESESVKERKGKEGKGIESESAGEAAAAPGHSGGDPLAHWAHRIVATYPRREGIADALNLVYQQLAAGTDPQAMLDGTAAAAKAIQAAPSGHLNKYVPGAAKFFRDRRWLDDPATLLRGPDPAGPKGTKPELTDAERLRRLGGRGPEEDAA